VGVREEQTTGGAGKGGYAGGGRGTAGRRGGARPRGLNVATLFKKKKAGFFLLFFGREQKTLVGRGRWGGISETRKTGGPGPGPPRSPGGGWTGFFSGIRVRAWGRGEGSGRGGCGPDTGEPPKPPGEPAPDTGRRFQNFPPRPSFFCGGGAPNKKTFAEAGKGPPASPVVRSFWGGEKTGG